MKLPSIWLGILLDVLHWDKCVTHQMSLIDVPCSLEQNCCLVFIQSWKQFLAICRTLRIWNFFYFSNAEPKAHLCPFWTQELGSTLVWHVSGFSKIAASHRWFQKSDLKLTYYMYSTRKRIKLPPGVSSYLLTGAGCSHFPGDPGRAIEAVPSASHWIRACLVRRGKEESGRADPSCQGTAELPVFVIPHSYSEIVWFGILWLKWNEWIPCQANFMAPTIACPS